MLSQIEDAELPHPLGPLLASFITGAAFPAGAAQYLGARLRAGEARAAVTEWAYILDSGKSALSDIAFY